MVHTSKLYHMVIWLMAVIKYNLSYNCIMLLLVVRSIDGFFTCFRVWLLLLNAISISYCHVPDGSLISRQKWCNVKTGLWWIIMGEWRKQGQSPGRILTHLTAHLQYGRMGNACSGNKTYKQRKWYIKRGILSMDSANLYYSNTGSTVTLL